MNKLFSFQKKLVYGKEGQKPDKKIHPKKIYNEWFFISSLLTIL